MTIGARIGPAAEARLWADAEALASAGVLAEQAGRIEAARARLAAALAEVRWRSGAAEAGTRQGQVLLAQLRQAAEDCLLAARLLRAAAAPPGADP